MNKNSSLILAVSGLLGGALASFAGYRLGSATADVPPLGSRLFYAGQLTNGTGLLTGNHVVKAEFFAAAMSGSPICTPPTVNSNPVNGTFTIDTSMCDAAFKAASSVYVQLTIDPGTTQTMIPAANTPRPQVGATPFAVEAERSQTAASVAFTNVTGTNVAWPGTVEYSKVSVPRICGVSSATSNGAFTSNGNGYQVGTQICRATAGNCTVGGVIGTFANSHICTAEEIVRSVASGFNPPTSTANNLQPWYASGVRSDITSGNVNDCGGFTVGTADTLGPAWNHISNTPAGYPAAVPCNTLHPVMCCL